MLLGLQFRQVVLNMTNLISPDTHKNQLVLDIFLTLVIVLVMVILIIAW